MAYACILSLTRKGAEIPTGREVHAANNYLIHFAFALAGVTLSLLLWHSGGEMPPSRFVLLADPRVGPAGFGALAVHAILCNSERRQRIVLWGGVLLEVVRFLLLSRSGQDIGVLAFSIGYGFSAAALVDFAFHREWTSAEVAALLPVGMLTVPLGLAQLLGKFTPLTYDGALYALDGVFRVPFSSLAADLFTALPALSALSILTYAAMPAAISAGLAYEVYNRRRATRRGTGASLLLAYMICGVLPIGLYMLCPGTGPRYAFSDDFPAALPNPASVPLTVAAFAPTFPRNAMPSFHFVWAFILARSTAGSRRTVRLASLVFLVLTILATLGSGEHYFVDLLAAVPLVIALEGATANRSIPGESRALAAIVGGALCLGWIFAVRSAPSVVPFLRIRPVLAWFLLLSTLAISALVSLRHHGSMKSTTSETPSSVP